MFIGGQKDWPCWNTPGELVRVAVGSVGHGVENLGDGTCRGGGRLAVGGEGNSTGQWRKRLRERIVCMRDKPDDKSSRKVGAQVE